MSVVASERIIDQQVGEYLYNLSTYPAGQARLDGLTEQILSHGNASVREVIPVQGVAVPAEVTREDLLDVTLDKLAAQAKRARAPFLAVIGANLTKDADTVDATPDYLKVLQEEFAKSTTDAWFAYPSLRHSRLPEASFPNANKLLAWFDEIIASAACSPSAFSLNLGSWSLGYSFEGEAYGEMGRTWNDIKHTVGEGTVVAYPINSPESGYTIRRVSIARE